MGDLVNSIFGGSGSQEMEKAQNYAKANYDQGVGYLSPYANGGSGAMGMMGGLMGINGTQAQSDAFKNYMNSTGYNFLLNSGSQAITDNAAARGLLKSGATAKALTTFGQNLASTKTQDFMNNLMGMSQVGAGSAANIMSGGQDTAALQGKLRQQQADDKTDAWGSLFNAGMSIAGMI